MCVVGGGGGAAGWEKAAQDLPARPAPLLRVRVLCNNPPRPRAPQGAVYSGSYLESAAYNPSLPPLQTAIIDAVIDGMPGAAAAAAGRRLRAAQPELGWLLASPLGGASTRRPPPHTCPCRPPAAYTELGEVVLVELAGGAVRHAHTAHVVLEQIAPKARLTVLEAEWAP